MKYLGIDWANDEHVVALVDDEGTEIDVWTVPYHGAGVQSLLDRLDDEGGTDQVVVALEAGARRLCDALVAAGYGVYRIHPLAAARYRDLHGASRAKDDRRDALSIARAVRLDRRNLKRAELSDSVSEELVLRCRRRRGLVDHKRRLMQQLRQVLQEYHPALIELGRPLTSALPRALLKAYPTPGRARRARRPRLARLLRESGARKLDVEQLREILRIEPVGLSAGAQAAYADHARHLLGILERTLEELADAEEAIARLFEEHPDREILESVPGVGVAYAPYLAAEIRRSLGDALTPKMLQTYAGTAPCTRKSGKQRRGAVRMRRACDRDLQAALFGVARCSVTSCAWARAYVENAVAHGKPYNTAIRALSNKWAKILATRLTRRETYDDELHTQHLRRMGVPWVPKAREEAA